MSASYNFRTAFNGFNREDVVHYIEYINSKNTAQVNQLKSDLAAAQEESQNLRTSAQEAQTAELAAQIAELSAKCAALTAELETVTAQRDEALAQQAQVQSRSDEELEAYRRAERVERQAQERTQAMYQKANAIVADATVKVDEASGTISGIADEVAAQLAVLQEAVSGSKQALKDAAASLYAIRPESME